MTTLFVCPKCCMKQAKRLQVCPDCGHPVGAPFSASMTPAHQKKPDGTARTADNGQISWKFDIPLITNRFILYDLLKTLAISGFVLCLLLFGIDVFSGDLSSLPYMFALAGICIGIFALAMLLGMLLFFGNRMPTRFVLTKRGARVLNLSRRSKVGNRLAIALGLFAGARGLSTAGAGMLAAAQERTELEWGKVRKVHFHPAQRVISLMNSWRVVVRLYCTFENYEKVAGAVSARAMGSLKAKDTGKPPQ